MDKKHITQKTTEFVKGKLSGEGTGHDWFHVERVVRNAKLISKKEPNADTFIVELIALLHDIADWKFHEDGEDERVVRDWLNSLELEAKTIEKVVDNVRGISFKGGKNPHKLSDIEGKIVQDADRLDALGAIGVARTFAFGGARGREMYNPDIKPMTYSSFEDFKKKIDTNTTVNHFYEKLFKLKDLMNTKKGKEMADEREAFMNQFLEHFYSEWEGRE